MKRWWFLFPAVLLLLLTGCGLSAWKDKPETQLVNFYYAASADASYGTQTGGLGMETRDLGDQSRTWQQLLQIYLRGPEDPLLKRTFPADLQVESAELSEQTLNIRMNASWDAMTGVELQLAEACLMMTATQFDAVQAVRIWTQADSEPREPLKPGDYLLYDDFATSDQITVKLYFSDLNGRFLVEETRDFSADVSDSLPDYIVRQLLAGPQTENALPALPEGTGLLGVYVEQGVCTVNLSEVFLANQPASHVQARMAVFSVVNSLTELPEIDCVRFLCAGSSIGDYRGLDLTQPMYREEMALKPSRTGAASLETTLYVPCGTGDMLAAVPAAVRQSAGKSDLDAILGSLLSFKPANGYDNPFPDGTVVVEQTVVGDLCKVTFNNAFALLTEEPERLQLAIRSLVATLCAQEGIERVQIFVYNAGLQIKELQDPVIPSPDWILP